MRQSVGTKADIIKVMMENRARLLALGARKIGLFSSFVRNAQGPASDVDLLVEFEEEMKTFDNFMELSFLLEDLLGRRTEIITMESLSPYIGPKILEEVEYVTLAA